MKVPRFILCASFFLGSVAAQAQPPAPRATKQDAVSASLSYFAAHDFSAAIGVLTTCNINPTGTAAWNVETAVMLIRAADALRLQGDFADETAALAAAKAAFRQAETLFTAATPPEQRANEQELLGRLAERLGDRAGAQKYYQNALSISPQSGQAADLLATLERGLVEDARKH